MHVYHIDPVRLYEINQSRYYWLIDLLIDELTSIEARDLHIAATAALTPFQKPAHAKSALKRWQKAYTVRPARRLPLIKAHDPEKARRWFEERGIEVIHQPKSEG